MPDLKERLEAFAFGPSPDLWARILEREPSNSNGPPRRARRAALIVTVLTIASAGIALPLRAFLAARAPAPRVSPTTVAFHPHVVGVTQVGPTGQVTSALYAAGSAWTTSYAGLHETRYTLTRVDPGTHSVVARIVLPGVPIWETGGGGMAFGDGSVWVTGNWNGPRGHGPRAAFLARVDPTTNRVSAVVGLGAGYSGADISIAGRVAWVALMGRTRGEVVRVDAATNKVTFRVPLSHWYVRWIVGTSAWVVVLEEVGAFPNAALETIDPRTGAVRPLPSGTWGRYQTIVGWKDQVWATDDRGFVRIDPRTGRRMGTAFVAENSSWAVRAPSSDGIWYAQGGVLYRFDPRTRSLARVFDLAAIGYQALAVGGGSAWLLGFDGVLTQLALN